MKIVIASDHAGLNLKNDIVDYLKKTYDVEDLGPTINLSVDYPDYAKKVCEKISNDCIGILVCYTGIGMSIAANKYKGVRAALVSIVEDAKLTREHNDANVLCLSAKNLDITNALNIVDTFITTPFSHGRHEARVLKIKEIEENNFRK